MRLIQRYRVVPAAPASTSGRLLAAQAAGSFGMAAGGVSGSLLAVRFTGSQAAGVVPAGALALGAAVSAPLITAIMQRRGRLSGLMAGYAGALGGALAALAASLLGSAPLLFAASLVFGAGTSTVMLTRYALADQADPGFRGRALSRSLVVTTVGAVVAPNLLAPAAVLATPWGLPDPAGLYLVSVAGFGSATLLLWTATHDRSVYGGERSGAHLSTQNGDDGDGGETPDREQGPRGRREWRGRRARRQAFLVLAAANGVMVTLMTMAAVDLHHHGHDLTSVGLMVSLHVAAMFALAPVFGWLADRIGPRPLALAGAGLLAATGGAGVLAAPTGMVGMTALVMALGLGWSVQVVAGSSLLIEATLVDTAPTQSRQRIEGRAELAMGLAAGFGSLLGAAPLAAVGGFRLLSAGAVVVSAATLLHLARRPSRSEHARLRSEPGNPVGARQRRLPQDLAQGDDQIVRVRGRTAVKAAR